jgi:hypothetical protein
MFQDGTSPTNMLTFWARDRVRGPRLTVEHAVQKQVAILCACASYWSFLLLPLPLPLPSPITPYLCVTACWHVHLPAGAGHRLHVRAV